LVVFENQVNQPGGAQLEYAEQFLQKMRDTDDVDSLDLRDFPLVHVEIDCDRLRSSGVTVVVTSRRKDAGQILAFEFLLGLIRARHGRILRPSWNPNVAQPCLTLSFSNSFIPTKSIEAMAPLFENHDQHVSLTSSLTSRKNPVANKGPKSPPQPSRRSSCRRL